MQNKKVYEEEFKEITPRSKRYQAEQKISIWPAAE